MTSAELSTHLGRELLQVIRRAATCTVPSAQPRSVQDSHHARRIQAETQRTRIAQITHVLILVIIVAAAAVVVIVAALAVVVVVGVVGAGHFPGLGGHCAADRAYSW